MKSKIYKIVLIMLGMMMSFNVANAQCPNPPVPSISANGPTTFCEGGSVTLNAGSYSSYSWSGPNAFSSTNQSIFASIAGTYSVTVTDANGCTGTTSQSVTVYSNPIPTITPNGQTTFCQGGSVMLDAGSYAAYSWSTGATDEVISATTSNNFRSEEHTSELQSLRHLVCRL